VVLYGLIAILAVSWRRVTAMVAIIISLTVGLSTIYLDTHWLSDVVGGWMAGGLVLLSLPTLMPHAERATARAARFVRRHLPQRRPVRAQLPARHAPAGAVAAPVTAPGWSAQADLSARR
jgi:undecaprenyl-diphosphatase